MKPIVLVSGATTTLGRRCAQHLSNSGYRIYELSRKDFEGETLQQDSFASVSQTTEVNIYDSEQIAKYILDIWNSQGPIQAVINCHGYGLVGPLEETTPYEANRVFQASVVDIISICHSVLPLMRMRGKGLIVNVSMEGRNEANSFEGVYEASRSAMESLSQTLAQEVHPFGIDVSLVRAPRNRARNAGSLPIAESASRSSAYGEAFEARKAAEKEKRESQPDVDTSPCTTTLLVERLVKNACENVEGQPGEDEGASLLAPDIQRAPRVLRQVQRKRGENRLARHEEAEREKETSWREDRPSLGYVSFAGIWEEPWRRQVEEAITSFELYHLENDRKSNPKEWTCTGRLVNDPRGIFTAHRHEGSGSFQAETSEELARLIRSRTQSYQYSARYNASTQEGKAARQRTSQV